MKEEISGAPVYLLGAGFSRAIATCMPLTNELGEAVALRTDVSAEELSALGGFEAYLSQLMTRMPFLEGHENASRAASAERMIGAIASELDLRVDVASSTPPPLWLEQLVALWHAERAVVITLNYDTLVELAVSAGGLSVSRAGSDRIRIYGSQVVDPAPSLDRVTTYGSQAPPSDDSFQLIKLHGSLNWYWTSGDPASATREYQGRAYGEAPAADRARLPPVRLLDRLLIPPVSSKDSYYSSTLTEKLWRSAREAIRNTSRLTVLGYSFPNEDHVVSALIQQAPERTRVELVDKSPGDPNDGKPCQAGSTVSG